jgi:hypothetical protein
MYLCVLDREGNKRLHRNMRAKPVDFLRAIKPFRDGLVVGVECMFTWYWLADLCLDKSLNFVLGHGGRPSNRCLVYHPGSTWSCRNRNVKRSRNQQPI